MHRNSQTVVVAAIGILLVFIPTVTSAILLSSGVTLTAVDESGTVLIAQDSQGTPSAVAALNINNLGSLHGWAEASNYQELRARLIHPRVPTDWPTYEPFPGWIISGETQARAIAEDIIRLEGVSGTGAISWLATLAGTFSGTAYSASASLSVSLTSTDPWDYPYYSSRSVIVETPDCVGGVCNENLNIVFENVPFDVPMELEFSLIGNGVLFPGSSPLNLNMYDTATLLVTEITDQTGAQVDLSLLQADSGTDYTKVPASAIPEPATLALIVFGLVGLSYGQYRSKKTA